MNTLSGKKKTCGNKACRAKFVPDRPFQKACGIPCGMVLGKEDLAKKKAKQALEQAKAERKQHREDKAKLKTRNEHLSDTQDAFNAYVRERDFDLPCVSCGDPNPPQRLGGQWDAGHFLSRGAHPELRFTEDNCAKQCKTCNGGSGRFRHKDRTVAARFELELLQRIGPDRLATLKGPHEPAKWTIEELNALKKHYRAETRKLVKLREARV